MKSKKVKLNYLITVLIALVVVLVLVSSFSVYESLRTKEVKETYTAEEIIEPEEVIPSEEEEIPTIEEAEEEVELLNEVTIVINNLRFYPEKVTISPGTTVIWINNDTAPHKVVAYDRLFYGPRMSPGDKYAFTFTKEGTHRYFDAVFPKIGRGRVIVKEEPLPITGDVVRLDLSRNETNGKFALLVLLFVIMIFGLSHGIYTSYKRKK